MSFIRNIKFGVALGFVAAGLNANAGATKILTVKDWELWESDNGAQTICYVEAKGLSVIGSNGAQVSTLFRVSKVKNSLMSPAELVVQLVKNPKGSTGLLVNTEKAMQVPFVNMDASRLNFWGIPKSLTNITERITANTYLKVLGVGGQKDYPVPVTASGYSVIIKELENRCNGGVSILMPQFEQEFLAQIPDSIDPTRLDVAKAGSLRSIYHSAYKAFMEISATKLELAQLLARYQSFIDELKSNRETANNVQNVQLPIPTQDLKNALNRQAEARAELSRIEALIPGLNAKIAKSQKVLDAAKAVIAPLQPEHDRIEQNLINAQNTLSEAQNRLNYIDTRLRDGAQQLISIRAEADTIENWLPQRRNDLRRATEFYRDAQYRRANFNMNWERDQRLRNNYEYSRLLNERNQMQMYLNQAQNDTRRLRVERDRVAIALQQCRAQPIVAEGQVTEAAHEPRPPQPPSNGGGGLVPGPSHPPSSGGDNGGGLTPAPAAPDCSHLENALNVANSQVAQSEAAERNYAIRINDINSRLYNIERQVDWDVRNEYNFLVNRENEARRECDRLDSEIRNGENRVAQIRNVEIPNLENEQRSLSSERPSVIARISDAQSNVSRFSQELARFNAANDWDNKVAAVDSATRQLQSDQSNLAAVLSQKQQEQQKLDLNIRLAREAQAKIDTLNAQLDALNKRAAELNEALKNLPAERAPLDDKIASLQSDIDRLKAEFLALLR